MEYIINGARRMAEFLGLPSRKKDVGPDEADRKDSNWSFFTREEKTIKEEVAVVEEEVAEAVADAEPDEMWDIIDDFLADGKKVNAIKTYRTMTGEGLKEAKQAIDAYIAEEDAA